MKPAPPDLSTRIMLKVPEAAAALGMSESALRRALPELSGCVVRVGGSVRLSVDGLRRWVDSQALAQDQAANADADCLLRGL
jgi:hypothetical protein